MSDFGILRGVGVGPGDPQLMTFKAAGILRESRIVAYVMDEGGESYARRIAAAHFPPSVRELPLRFSMSCDREERLAARAQVSRQVLAFLSAGADVTFITEGDPLLYSTFQHLLDALPQDTPVEICPGVSSLTASPAEARFSLVTEEERMVVATLNPESLRRIPEWLDTFEVIVLFKAHRQTAALLTAMENAHHRGKALLVQRASLAGQASVTDLAAWDGSALPYFTTALIRSK